MKIRRLLQCAAAFCAAALFCSGINCLPASAADRLVGYTGDVNTDMQVNKADVEALLRHLTGEQPLTDDLAGFSADIDDSYEINAKDLTLLKRMLLNGEQPAAIYDKDSEKELISPPILANKPTFPSVGEGRVLLVAVEFPGCTFERSFTADEIYNIAFGEEDTESPYYPLESITAYYDRASYGRLHLSGEAYKYTAQNPIEYYQVDDGDGELSVAEQNRSITKVVDEVLGALDSEIDYNDYNLNDDHYIDTVLIALPATTYDPVFGVTSRTYWWPCSGRYTGGSFFDGLWPGNICIGGWALTDCAGFNNTWIHELGHAMGLPDYYCINENSSTEGLNGEAGHEMMDEAEADMCSFGKMMYGWYAEDELQIYTGGTQTFTLESSQRAPSCLMIPTSGLDSFFGEYFMVEYNTPEGNNTRFVGGGYTAPFFREGGVRILHCEASRYFDMDIFAWQFRWENFSRYYDNSHQKQRVIRLVNDGNGFFKAGDTVSSSTPGFAWYDRYGGQTVDPGIILHVDQIENGKATVTVSPKP